MPVTVRDNGINGIEYETTAAADTAISIKNKTSNTATGTITGAGAVNVSSNLTVAGDIYCTGGDIKNTTANAGLVIHGYRNAGSDTADVTINSTVTRTAGQLLSATNSGTAKFQVNYLGLPGFYGATAPTAQVALTQTYNTADATLSAYTADNESVLYSGGSTDAALALVADLNALRVAYENLRAHAEDIGKFVNSLVDALQAEGLIG